MTTAISRSSNGRKPKTLQKAIVKFLYMFVHPIDSPHCLRGSSAQKMEVETAIASTSLVPVVLVP
eukprot:2510350-Amphidinium_carterae.1